MLTLYGVPKSRSLRVSWMLAELGADYNYVKIDYANRDPAFLKANPAGKVPTLTDGEFALTESVAIVTYLGDKFGRTDLVPEEDTQRAKYLQWCCFTISELEQGLWTIAKHRFAIPEERRVPAVIETGSWEFAQASKLLAQGLGNQSYILGEAFSAADILLSHTLMWADGWEQPLSDPLRAYMNRCKQRPALREAATRERS